MKYFTLMVIASALGSCSASPPPTGMAPADQARLAALTAGKVAGTPTSCLPTWRSNDMIVIDEHNIVFRDNSRRLYLNHMDPAGCLNIDGGRNALVTKTTTTNLCRGDIAQVLDTSSRMVIGSCVFGDFIPYTTPGS